MVAQITEDGIELGGFLTKFKVQVDDYADVVKRFSELNLELPKFKLDDGAMNWDAISEAIGGADERAMSYFKTLDDGSGTIDNSSASIQGMSTHLKATGQAFNFAAVKATLLNTALNAGIFLVASLAIEGFTNAIDKYVNLAEEAREKSTELSNAWKEDNSSLSDTISQYKELNEKLNDNSLTTEEVKSIKEQLTSIQDDLNQKYGEEANNIDIVNGKYDEQIAKLDELSKKKARDYIAENGSNVKEDKKYLSELISGDNTTDIARYQTNLGNDEQEKQYKEAEKIYKKYLKKYEALSLSYDYFKGTTGLRLNLKGTREEIQTQLSQLFSELNEDYKGNPPEFIQGLKDVITETLNMDDFDTTKIEDAKNNIKAYTEAEILANNKTRNLYNDSIDAVEKYNNALAEGKGINAAKKNLDDIKQKVSESIKGYEGYDTVFNDIFDAVQKTDNKIKEVTEQTDSPSTKSFSSVFNSEGYEDISKELLKLAEAGELTPNTLTSTKEYNALLKDTNTSAQEATKQLYNMIDANERLATFSSNMGNVDKAYAEFKTNGFNTMDTLSSMQSAFGDLDYYNKFIKIAGNAKSSTEQIQEAYNKLVTEYVYSIGILDTVNESNRGMIQTQLEQLGITNAEEIVTHALNGEIMSLSEAKAILTKQGLDLLKVTSSELTALVKEGNVTKDTAKQIALFALKKKIANGVSITTDGDIANLAALAGVSSDVIEMMNSLASMKQKIAQGTGEAGTAGGRDYLESKAKALQKKIDNRLNKGRQINFNVDYSGGDATSSALEKQSKGAKKVKETYKKFAQTIDWCAETITNLSNKISNLNAKLSNTDGLQKQIKYYKELITAQNGLIKGYEKTNSKYKKTYNNSLSKLSKSDRKKVEDGTYTIEQFKGKTKSDSKKKSKAEKRYNKIQKALEARDTYLSSQTELVNAKQQFQEYAEALASIRWEDASEKVDKLNTKIGVLDTRMGNTSGYEAKNAILDEQLELQKQILDTQEKAVKKTQADANSYYKKISKKNKKNKNEDGTIKLEGVTNKKQIKYIKAYNAYVKQLADQTVALAQAQEDYKASVKEIKLEKADNIKTDYDNRISMFEDAQSRIEHEISLTEAQGQVASASYYDMLTNNARNIRNVRMSEKAALKEQLNGVTEYSDTWYSLKQQIFDVDRAIEEQTRNAVENTNKQIDAMKELTSLVNEQVSGATDALAWFDDLIDTEDLYDDDGNLTNKAYTSLKLKEGQIAGSQTRLGNYNKNMAELEVKYANGDIEEAKYLTEKLELEKNIRDEYKTQIDLRKEQNELIKDGYRAQKEALDKILEKKKKSLDYDLSEYNYRKNIAEKTKSITDLEKQLAMLQGDNSEEAKAKRQQIEVQLKENKEDLKDTQYEKYIERYEESMDNLSDRLDALIEKIDALPKEQIIQVIVNNEAKADEGTKEISQETEVPTSTLGEGEKIIENPIEQAPQTYAEINNEAEQAYNPSAVQIETPNPQPTIIEPEPVVVAQPEPQPIPQPVYPTEQDIRNGKLAWLKALTEETIRNTGVRAESADPDWHEINKYIWSKTGNKLPQDSLSSLADFAYQNGLADASIVARGSKGNLTSGAKDILLNLLRESGYANGGIVGQIQKVVKANGDDGLATLKVGEAVLTTQQTEDFREFVKYLRPLNNMFEVISQPSIPTVNRTANSSSTSIDNVNFEFNLPNVVDSESLIKTIQTDTKLQRTLQNATVGKLTGNTKFGVNRL